MSESVDFEFIHSEDEGNKASKACLLFHGLTGSPFEMKKYGQFLYKLGYDVFCYSFPGHGNRISEIQTATWNDWRKFAQEKYTTLRKNYEQFYVSGLCLGATMAIYLAEHNNDVTAVISLSTTLFLDGFCLPWSAMLLPVGAHTIIKYYYTFPEDKSYGLKNEKTRKSLAKLMSKVDIGLDNYPLNCVYGLLKLSKHVRNSLKKVTCPILCVHSEFDNLASTKGAKIVIKGVSSSIKKYVELHDSYHMILYDNEKEFVMNTVKDFLEQIDNTVPAKELELA